MPKPKQYRVANEKGSYAYRVLSTSETGCVLRKRTYTLDKQGEACAYEMASGQLFFGVLGTGPDEMVPLCFRFGADEITGLVQPDVVRALRDLCNVVLEGMESEPRPSLAARNKGFKVWQAGPPAEVVAAEMVDKLLKRP